MALRAREDWTTLLAAIRQLVREPVAAESFWTDATLLNLFNDSLDMRYMEMIEEDEGWAVDEHVTSLVANQREYVLPEGGDRVRRVWLIYVEGGTTREVEVRRDERPFSGMTHGGSGGTVSGRLYRPTYRLQADLLLLEPRPNASLTNGLRIEFEAPVGKLTGAASKVPQRYPITTETLLKYDTAVRAFALENNQDKTEEGYVNGLTMVRDEFAVAWRQYIKHRMNSQLFSTPYNLGD